MRAVTAESRLRVMQASRARRLGFAGSVYGSVLCLCSVRVRSRAPTDRCA